MSPDLSAAISTRMSRSDLNTLSEYRLFSDPAVDSSSVVSNLEPLAFDGFYQMKVLAS